MQGERIATFCVCCSSSELKSSPAIIMPFVSHRAFNHAPVKIDETWGLKTVPIGHAYSLCNSLQCEACGLLFCDVRFSDREMDRLYEDYRGDLYNQLREYYEPGYLMTHARLTKGVTYINQLEEFLEPHIKRPVRILDWGGDTGKNTPFKNKNECLDIFDISQKPQNNTVNKNELANKNYNLIVCSHVLEHVPYPAEILSQIKEIMNEDSVLYIEVPLETLIIQNLNIKSKRHWHEHINFFTEKSLNELCKHADLDVIDFRILNVSAGATASHVFQLACQLKNR